MAKNDAKIWCSDLMVTSKYLKSIEYESPPHPRPKDYWVRRCKNGEKVARHEFPDKMTARKPFASLPDVFTVVNNLPVVKQRFNDILAQFRLGESHLVEVPIWTFDMFRTFDGPFYFFNIAEKRSVFLPEENPKVTQRPNGQFSVTDMETPSVVVQSNAPADVDLWMDPHLRHVIFVSAPLAQAISAAKIKGFKLFPCPAAA